MHSCFVRRIFRTASLIVFSLSSLPCASKAAEGLDHKLIVGYQGWFGCPGDYRVSQGYSHWFADGPADVDHLAVDLLPEMSQIAEADRCPTHMHLADGTMVSVFSSQNANVVAAHFHMMQTHGIDGAAVQRFVSNLNDPNQLARRDHVLDNERNAAEANTRVFYVTYDISGAPEGKVEDMVRHDWMHLVNDLHVTDSPAYLHDRGKPVLELWGVGFSDRPGTPASMAALIEDLKRGNRGLRAVTIIGGVPSHWRTLSGDSKTDAAWAAVYRKLDVISPWSVGRFVDDQSFDSYLNQVVKPDVVETAKNGIRYQPVIFPGFSWYNIEAHRDHQQAKAIANQVPRRCGNFMWHQATGLLPLGVASLRAAMFDEFDEGTALMPVQTRADKLPVGSTVVYLNEDGCSLPADWYLQVTGKINAYLRNNQIPPARMQDVLRP
jgi:hypothetical protein